MDRLESPNFGMGKMLENKRGQQRVLELAIQMAQLLDSNTKQTIEDHHSITIFYLFQKNMAYGL